MKMLINQQNNQITLDYENKIISPSPPENVTPLEKQIDNIWQNQYSDPAKGKHPLSDRWVKHTLTFLDGTKQNNPENPNYDLAANLHDINKQPLPVEIS